MFLFLDLDGDSADHQDNLNNRSQLTETTDNKLIVDAYNANPTSMMAALENFRLMNVAHKMVILGDMKEKAAGDSSGEGG